MSNIHLYSDGGARGNPGPAAIGVVIEKDGEIIETISKYIGETTNNQAEYQALITGLEKAHTLGIKEIICNLDSELVVKQLNREYKVKNKDLVSLFIKAYNLSLQFKKISFNHIPRDKNKIADKLVNVALDNKI